MTWSKILSVTEVSAVGFFPFEYGTIKMIESIIKFYSSNKMRLQKLRRFKYSNNETEVVKFKIGWAISVRLVGDDSLGFRV